MSFPQQGRPHDLAGVVQADHAVLLAADGEGGDVVEAAGRGQRLVERGAPGVRVHLGAVGVRRPALADQHPGLGVPDDDLAGLGRAVHTATSGTGHLLLTGRRDPDNSAGAERMGVVKCRRRGRCAARTSPPCSPPCATAARAAGRAGRGHRAHQGHGLQPRAELAGRGLVAEGALVRPGSVGRPGTLVELDGRAVCGIGVEVNVDYLAALALDPTGAVRGETRLALDVAALDPPTCSPGPRRWSRRSGHARTPPRWG